MPRSRNQSACCGSGAGVRTGYPDLADALALERVEMARASGAETLVTACPWCVQSLRECQKGDVCIEVLDLVELIERSVRSDRK
jgi:Fe-S oxidoreductase